MNTQTRSSYTAGCQTQTCWGNNIWIFGPLSKSECNTHTHTDLFIFLLNNQTKLLKTLWVQLLVHSSSLHQHDSLTAARPFCSFGWSNSWVLPRSSSLCQSFSSSHCCSEDVSERLLLHPQLTFSHFLPPVPVSSHVGALLGGRGIGDRTRDVSQQFRLVLPLQQQAGIQAQEGVTNSHGAVHWSHQQGEEGQPLLPRRQREDNLTGNRHGNQPQQVDNLQRMEQKPLSTEGRVIRLLLKY